MNRSLDGSHPPAKGYDIASFGLRLASKWYADDGALIAKSVEDMISLLDIIQ